MTDIEITTPTTVIQAAGEKLLPQLIMGIIVVIAGFAMMPPMIGMGALLIITYFINANTEMVRISPEHSEVKLAIIRPRWFILNSSIKSADVNNKTLIIKTEEKEQSQIRKIPLNIFSEKDREEIIGFYQAQAEKNSL